MKKNTLKTNRNQCKFSKNCNQEKCKQANKIYFIIVLLRFSKKIQLIQDSKRNYYNQNELLLTILGQ